MMLIEKYMGEILFRVSEQVIEIHFHNLLFFAKGRGHGKGEKYPVAGHTLTRGGRGQKI